MEILQIYSKNGKKLKKKLSKGIVHSEGHWHRSFHCWIYSIKNKEVFLHFQRRSITKTLEPNKFDIAVAGHYILDEGIEGGLREIREELGIEVSLSDILYVGTRKCVSSPFKGYINKEFQDVFVMEYKSEIETYTPNLQEVSEIFEIEIDSFLSFLNDSQILLNISGICFTKKGHGRKECQIAMKDFFIDTDNYYLIVSHFIRNYVKYGVKGNPYPSLKF
jgi:isopentenyldiphosphate isomerase